MPFNTDDQAANKIVSDASTTQGQLSTPVTKVSQSIPGQPLHEQLQDTTIRSVSKDKINFYQLNDDDILLDASLEPKELMINESYKIKVRDPGMYAYYWGEYRAKQGLRFAQLKAMGFTPASPEEVIEHQAEIVDGKLILGDVMLLKMPKQKYAAHLKKNLYKSNDMLKPQTALEKAKARAGTLVTGGYGMPNMAQHKGEFFIPQGQDVRDVPVNPQSAVEQKVYEAL